MSRMTLTAGLSEDKQTAVVEMREDGNPLAHMIFDAATLEDAIHKLAQARAELADEVPQSLDPGSRLSAIRFPAWRVPDTHNGPSGTMALALRHPGLGWLSFLLEEGRSREIGQALLDTPPTAP